ncbi:MAG: phenylalanine--tRNA ligase subunit beta, partial [Acidiferrobacterales bacterium]
MKVSEQWLREWVSPKLDTTALAERLTLGGLEVSAVEPASPDLRDVIIGEIVQVQAHPQAERLKLCSVNVGRKKPLEVVSGADNAAPELRTPVALPGARLPNGVTVEKAEIGGVQSAAMLCSAVDIGLAESATGLLELGRAAPVGNPIAGFLQLDDQVIDIEVTPNRGDCLSVAGIAREVAALTGARLREPTIRRVIARGKRRFKVQLRAKQDCARYVGRVIEGINATATTPLWMVERLRRSGVRSISPVVDVTNYVMLELGQPMHAFDLDRLNGGIQVRHATANESLTLLDGTQARLEAGTLIIADDRGPVALAGIIGGLDSAVSDQTRSIFLESAYFRPETIAERARRLGVQTESSHRFERGVDPQLQRKAVERATALLLSIVGGKPGVTTEAKLDRYIHRR